MELPNQIVSGEVARLIPVIADTRKEQRVASVFLATLAAVPDYAKTLLLSVGHRTGPRSIVSTYTEVSFSSSHAQPGKSDRPDGLIHVQKGKKEWLALVEAKIGNSPLDQEQVERYLRLAKGRDIDAVITISNQFAARPDHHPISVPRSLTRKTSLFHWSWSFALTEAILLQKNSGIEDPDQAFILKEFVRFISHDSVGVKGFEQMPTDWREAITGVQNGAVLKRNSPSIEAVIGAWHQEIRDLELKLSFQLGTNIKSKLERAHISDPEKRMRDATASLAETNLLTASLVVPNAAAPLEIAADLKTRSIRVGMQIDAPLDKQRGTARVNWLLRQIPKSLPDGICIGVKWPTRIGDTICTLQELRDDTAKVLSEGNGQPPRAFDIFAITDDVRRFSGRRTFIEDLEQTVPRFYADIGQHLQTWRPKPPKAQEAQISSTPNEQQRKDVASEPNVEAEKPIPVPQAISQGPSGMRGLSLIDMPSFLRRR